MCIALACKKGVTSLYHIFITCDMSELSKAPHEIYKNTTPSLFVCVSSFLHVYVYKCHVLSRYSFSSSQHWATPLRRSTQNWVGWFFLFKISSLYLFTGFHMLRNPFLIRFTLFLFFSLVLCFTIANIIKFSWILWKKASKCKYHSIAKHTTERERGGGKRGLNSIILDKICLANSRRDGS